MINDNLNCNEWKVLEVRYLKVRREEFLHIDSANHDDPYDYTLIIKNFAVYSNNVSEPFVRYSEEEYPVTIEVPSPCGNGSMIPANVKFLARHTIASGNYGPILFASNIGVLNGSKEFFGLDQYTDVYLPGENIPDYNYDIVIKLLNGDGVTGGVGYTGMSFVADKPNGNIGTYFFKIEPLAQISHDNLNH